MERFNMQDAAPAKVPAISGLVLKSMGPGDETPEEKQKREEWMDTIPYRSAIGA